MQMLCSKAQEHKSDYEESGAATMLMDFSKKKFDIIIQGGQSNAEGYGFGEVDVPYQPNGRVWYFQPDFTIARAAERVLGNELQGDFSLSFAKNYVDSPFFADDRDLLILRCAVGGTGFADKRWRPQDDLFLTMMDMIRTALSLNNENRLVAFLWHQGETDAMSHASFDTHYNNMKTLLSLVMDEFNVPELPFIAADFVPQWRELNEEISAPVIDAVRAVCDSVPNGRFVETAGLHCNFMELKRPSMGWEDNIHFCRRSLYELGTRYFEAYATCINKKQ